MPQVSLPADPTVVYILVALFAGAVVLGLVFVRMGRVPSVPDPGQYPSDQPPAAADELPPAIGDAQPPSAASQTTAGQPPTPWSTGTPSTAPPWTPPSER